MANAILRAQGKHLRMTDLVIALILDRHFLEIKVSAQPGYLTGQADTSACRRIVNIIPRIRDMLQRHAARRTEIVAFPRRPLTGAIPPIIDMSDILILAVEQRHIIRGVLADRPSERNLSA